MRRTLLVITLVCLWSGNAGAEWVSVSQTLPETDIHYVIADPKEPKRLYAASGRRLYRSTDQGLVWKRLLSLRSTADAINAIHFDPLDDQHLFLATNKGIRYSTDRGIKWQLLYQAVGEKEKKVSSLVAHPTKSDSLLAGTAQGLLVVDKNNGQATPVAGFPHNDVYAIWTDQKSVVFVTSSKGIWRSLDGAQTWYRVYSHSEKERSDEGSLEQFQIEELSLLPSFSNMVQMSGGKLVTASKQRLLESALQNGTWSLGSATSMAGSVQYLAASPDALYAATDQGVYVRSAHSNEFQNISDGLGSLKAQMLYFNPKDNTLYAATQKGVYRFAYPDLSVRKAEKVEAVQESKVALAAVSAPMTAQEVLKRFESEPSVRDIQQAAIRYAEVHPEKIEAWRKAAAKKALFPTVSLRTDASRDENVDLDRGGTNDPDQFIQGPADKSTDWSVGASWDLGDIIWNGDQTSIDTRSKLMVELRDDVLTEVTHIYYERRRLQVDLLLAPPKDVALAVEKDLKLQELTANIDGLTGGYLSKQLEVLHGTNRAIQ
jgi:hypothetical protein